MQSLEADSSLIKDTIYTAHQKFSTDYNIVSALNEYETFYLV